MIEKESRGSPVCRNLGFRPKGPGLRLIANHKPSCTLTPPSACKIHRRYIIFQVPCKVKTSGVPWQSDELATYSRTKIAEKSFPDNPSSE